MLLSKDGCFRKTMNGGRLGPVRKEGRRHLFGENTGQGLRNGSEGGQRITPALPGETKQRETFLKLLIPFLRKWGFWCDGLRGPVRPWELCKVL